jgi:hypothetical protein
VLKVKVLLLALSALLVSCGGSYGPVTTQVVTKQVPVARGQYGFVVLMGDSIAADWGNPLVQPIGHIVMQYVPYLADVASSDEPSSELSLDVQAVIGLRPKVIILQAGLGDVGRSDGLQATRDIVDAVQSAGVAMVLSTLPGNAYPEWNAGIRQIAAETGSLLADYSSIDPSLLQADGVHPIPAGFDWMWGVLCVTLDPYNLVAE